MKNTTQKTTKLKQIILHLLPGLLLAAFLTAATALPAAAQSTDLLKVEDSAGEPIMTLDDTGRLEVKGEINVSSLNGNALLLWFPAKAAFRAGFVQGTQWDDANIGDLSVAMGFNTTASGNSSIALGNRTTASGSGAIAMGILTIASGLQAMAWGSNTEASGDRSTAMGTGTKAIGINSTAMGLETKAIGHRSTAMGEKTIAATNNSLAIGKFNSANQTSDGTLFVVGNGSSDSDRSDALVLDQNGNLTIAGSLTESSDIRLKTDIKPLDNLLRHVLDLKPISYRFKPNTNHPHDMMIGLSAQDVQKEFPALISKNSKGYLSLSYTHLTAVLVGAINEQHEIISKQQASIEELRKRIEEMKANQTELEQRLEKLEALILKGGNQ